MGSYTHGKGKRLNVRVISLKKTRNPTEYGFQLVDQVGKFVHDLEDGYWLIEFDQYLIDKQIRVVENGKKKYKTIQVPLQWYIHETDRITA